MQFGIWYVCDMNKWKECSFTQTHATHTMLLVNNLLSLIWTRISSALTHLQLAASASCLSTQSPRCYRRGRVCAEVWPPVAGLLRPDFCHCKSAAAQAARSPSGGRTWEPNGAALVQGGSDQPCPGLAPGRQEAPLLFPSPGVPSAPPVPGKPGPRPHRLCWAPLPWRLQFPFVHQLRRWPLCIPSHVLPAKANDGLS